MCTDHTLHYNIFDWQAWSQPTTLITATNNITMIVHWHKHCATWLERKQLQYVIIILTTAVILSGNFEALRSLRVVLSCMSFQILRVFIFGLASVTEMCGVPMHTQMSSPLVSEDKCHAALRAFESANHLQMELRLHNCRSYWPYDKTPYVDHVCVPFLNVSEIYEHEGHLVVSS